jgi:hypothetical protein
MFPKKGRRKIIVNDVLYYYKISGCITVVIQNSETNEIIKWHKEWKEKWNMELKPSDIREIISKHNNCA